MDTQIVRLFCLFDDLLKGLHHVEDRQSQLSDAEMMTAAIFAMLYFRGNFRMACQFLCAYDDIASKKHFFYGVRVPILITESGQPVEFFLAPGAMRDTATLSRYNLDVPEGSWFAGDKVLQKAPAPTQLATLRFLERAWFRSANRIRRKSSVLIRPCMQTP